MVFPLCVISDGCSSLCRVLLAGALQYSIARHVQDRGHLGREGTGAPARTYTHLHAHAFGYVGRAGADVYPEPWVKGRT